MHWHDSLLHSICCVKLYLGMKFPALRLLTDGKFPPKLQFACSCEWRGANCRGYPFQTAMIPASGVYSRSSSIRKQSSSGTQMCIKTLASPLFNPTSPYTLPIIMCLEATSPSFITQCPATCELCSQWLPNHSVSASFTSHTAAQHFISQVSTD